MDCVRCGAALPTAAGFCPQCGASVSVPRRSDQAIEDDPRRERRRLFIVGFVCLAIGLIIGRGFGWGGFQGFDSWDDHERAAVGTPVATTAVEFFDTFKANANAARSRFDNRPLLVTGTVVRLDKVDHPWGPDVLLATSDPAKTLLADLLPDSHAAAASLKAGQAITVGCEQVEESSGPDPWLKNCMIEQEPAAPPPPPAAEPPTAPRPPAEP